MSPSMFRRFQKRNRALFPNMKRKAVPLGLRKSMTGSYWVSVHDKQTLFSSPCPVRLAASFRVYARRCLSFPLATTPSSQKKVLQRGENKNARVISFILFYFSFWAHGTCELGSFWCCRWHTTPESHVIRLADFSSGFQLTCWKHLASVGRLHYPRD